MNTLNNQLPIKRVSVFLYIFIYHKNSSTKCSADLPWSDVALCGVWSGSPLFLKSLLSDFRHKKFKLKKKKTKVENILRYAYISKMKTESNWPGSARLKKKLLRAVSRANGPSCKRGQRPDQLVPTRGLIRALFSAYRVMKSCILRNIECTRWPDWCMCRLVWSFVVCI